MRCVVKDLDERVASTCIEDACDITQRKAEGDDRDETHCAIDADAVQDSFRQSLRGIFDLLSCLV